MHTYRKNLLLMDASFVSIIKNIMTKKARANLKMMTKIAIGISLAVNVIIVPIGWAPADVSSLWQLLFFFFKLPFVAMILTIVLSFGAILGESLFKMITPQEDYIKRSKANLILTEFIWCLMLGIVPNGIILFVFF